MLCYIEHDPRESVHLIDTARCPVYFANDGYDPSTSFKEGQEPVAEINGSVWIAMPGIGHFPMTEDWQPESANGSGPGSGAPTVARSPAEV